jgi:hypothetical protein
MSCTSASTASSSSLRNTLPFWKLIAAANFTSKDTVLACEVLLMLLLLLLLEDMIVALLVLLLPSEFLLRRLDNRELLENGGGVTEETGVLAAIRATVVAVVGVVGADDDSHCSDREGCASAGNDNCPKDTGVDGAT